MSCPRTKEQRKVSLTKSKKDVTQLPTKKGKLLIKRAQTLHTRKYTLRKITKESVEKKGGGKNIFFLIF